MKTTLIMIACLFISGCHRIAPRYPVINTRPPQYIWVCNKNAEGTIVCDSVASEKDVPSGYQCIWQNNGIESCWPSKMTLPREQK